MSEQTLNGRLCRLVDDLVGQGISLQQALREFERQFLLASLRENDGSLSRSATALGMHRNTLRNKMDALGIAASEGPAKLRRRSTEPAARARRAR